MLLIADSGSTKTDWWLVKDKEIIKDKTVGFNPYFQTTEQIIEELSSNLVPHLKSHIEKEKLSIYFYGAGCSSEAKCSIVRNALLQVWPDAIIEIEHDLLAAARALCGRKPGIAAILGTGSNSCYYDGNRIVANVFSLGYLLGDEGSGAYLGKKMITTFLYNEFPEDLQTALAGLITDSKEEILDSIYKKPLPSRYLASFSRYIPGVLSHPAMHKLVYQGLDDFFKHHVSKYPIHKEIPFNCVGSVAFHYKDILKEIVEDRKMIMGKIIESPIEALVNYHLQPN